MTDINLPEGLDPELAKLFETHWANETPNSTEEEPAEETPETGPLDPADPSEEAPEPADDTDTDDASEEEEEAPEDAPPIPPTLSQVDELVLENGARITKDMARAYLDFENRLRNDPQLQKLLSDHYATPSAPAVDAPPPIDPIDLDLADPIIKALYTQNQALQSSIQNLNAYVARHESVISQDQLNQNAAYVNRAKISFAQERNLTTDEVDKIELTAANLNVLPSLLQGVDPITGQAVRPDPLAAVERALDIAYWQMPEYRQKELARLADEAKKERTKKGKLQAVSGSSGSVPRTSPAPRNDTERRSQMLEYVRSLANGTGE